MLQFFRSEATFGAKMPRLVINEGLTKAKIILRCRQIIPFPVTANLIGLDLNYWCRIVNVKVHK